MGTPFWQIKNKNFLTFRPLTNGNMKTCLFDLKRNLDSIRFNGRLVLDILLEDLKIDSTNMTIKEKMGRVSADVEEKHITALLKRELLSDVLDNNLHQHYADLLSSVIYQWGLVFSAAQSLTDNQEVADKGYIVQGPGLNTNVNIYRKNCKIIIDERTDLMSLGKVKGLALVSVGNKDGSSMMILKNRLELQLNPEGGLSYVHADLTLEYNSPLARSLYDKRSLLDMIIDFIKSIFRMNGIEAFSFEDDNKSAPTL